MQSKYTDPARLQELAEELSTEEDWSGLQDLIDKARAARSDSSTLHYYKGLLLLNTTPPTRDPTTHFRMVDRTSALFRGAIEHRVNLASSVVDLDLKRKAYAEISEDLGASPIGVTPFGLVVQAICCINSNAGLSRPCPLSRLEALLDTFDANWARYISANGDLTMAARVGEYVDFRIDDVFAAFPAHFILNCVAAGTAARESSSSAAHAETMYEVRRALRWRSLSSLDRLSADYLHGERWAIRLGGYCDASGIDSEMGVCSGANQISRRCRGVELSLRINPPGEVPPTR
ncbi:MAG: hypothetical protein K8J08_14490 [Thermoanaerobaculia bacterium]|nr:hypothetical protein [Thermoanaerobaculia bacterium]